MKNLFNIVSLSDSDTPIYRRLSPVTCHHLTPNDTKNDTKNDTCKIV
jgi:hypothetical protein